MLDGGPKVEVRSLRDGRFEIPIRWAGRGRPLVYLHDSWGSEWQPDGALDRLAAEYLVLAPSHPGCDGATGLEQLENIQDLALYYLSLLDDLQIESPHLVGHGLGGLIAAEMAIFEPRRIAKLVLIGAYGLRLSSTPIRDPSTLTLAEVPTGFWTGAGLSTTATNRAADQHRLTANLAAMARFIPAARDSSLRRWLYRLCAPTLLVWGENDSLVPPIYAEIFHELIAESQVALISDAGHSPHLEQPDAFVATVQRFLQG